MPLGADISDLSSDPRSAASKGLFKWLRKQKAEGVSRRLVGFEMVERGIARQGHEVFVGTAKAGVVTSGTQTPYLKKAIGMAYLPFEHSAAGSEFDVDIRGRRTRARVVPMPFYKRPKRAGG